MDAFRFFLEGEGMKTEGRYVRANRVMTRRGFVHAACVSSLASVAGLLLDGCGSQASAPLSAGSGSAPSSGASPTSNAVSVTSGSADPAYPIPKSAKLHEQLTNTLFAFDTVVTLKASCAPETMEALSDRCGYFESIFSRTIESSDIGRVNAAVGAPVEVAPETADIIEQALAYCKESNGLFDITIGAVSSLWDFKGGIVPDATALAEGVAHVDYTKVRLEGRTVTLLDSLAKLDLGGIAKGYIADDLCRMLVEAGCDSGFVNLGGNVKTVGVRPDGKPWHVGVQDPNDETGTVIAALYADPAGTSVVTSGLYERQFEKDGKRYWHILDPKTGYPVETDLLSATIVSKASIDGDGYTKPLFMMGCEKALGWIEGASGLEGLVVDAEGAIFQSSGCAAELL